MSMKQRIMEKLFAEKPLTNKEILHIGSCLSDNDTPEPQEGNVENKKVVMAAYDHTVKDSLIRACALTDADFEHINKLIRSEIIDRKDELDCNSKQVEVYEKIALSKPQNLRLLMYQFVKTKDALQKKEQSGSFGIRLGGNGGGGDFRDFLDFLKGQGGG